ncbi:hypothetical protein MXB_285, partial [Myxobolus squamalis]
MKFAEIPENLSSLFSAYPAILSDIPIELPEIFCFFIGNCDTLLTITIIRFTSILLNYYRKKEMFLECARILEIIQSKTNGWITEYHPIIEVLSNDNHKLSKALLDFLIFYSHIDDNILYKFQWINPQVLFKNTIKYFNYDSYVI